MRLLTTLDHSLLQTIARLVGRGERPGRSGRGAAAEARAKSLLLGVLTPKQREDFTRSGYFTVEVAGRGNFVILPDAMFNVLEPATGDCYCAVPATGVPIADLMLAQKLLLESDPDQFFRTANCRHEVVVGRMDDELLPEQVLRARKASPDARVRWSEVSMIPYRGYLP
jgi:hypothetical protein